MSNDVQKMHRTTDMEQQIITTIDQAFDDAIELLEQSDILKTEATERIQTVLDSTAMLIGDNNCLRDKVIHHVYWSHDLCRPSWLGSAFGVSAVSIKKLAGPNENKLKCPKCGCSIPIANRKEYKDVIDRRKRCPNDKYNWCRDCQNIANQEWLNSDEYKQQEEDKRIRKEQSDRYWHVITTMPYKDYLRTEHWKKTRNTYLKKSGFRCQVCNVSGKEQPLNVHHRTYERRGYESDRDLITLCADCHEIFHTTGKLNHE